MLYDSLQSSDRIAIFTHMNSDGDALGSSIGMMTFLDYIGKESMIFLPGSVSESLKFTIPADLQSRVVIWGKQGKITADDFFSKCDLAIGLDFNVLDRISNWKDDFAALKCKKILIDHHVGPQREVFDEVYSETEISSCCELLYTLLMETPVIKGDAKNLPDRTRQALMTGLTTDTNNFANSVYPSTLRMAADLLDAGTDRDSIIDNLYFSYPRRRLDMQGLILNKLMHVMRNGVAYFILDWRTQQRLHIIEGDTEGFVNIPLSLKNVRMSIFLKEENNHKNVRVSIRSKKGTSARQMAMTYFNGGGHELASGGRLTIGKELESIAGASKYIQKAASEFFRKAHKEN